MDYKVSKELKLPSEIFDARYHPKREDLICAATIAGNIHLIQNGNIISDTLRKHHKGAPIRRVRFDHDGRMVTIAKTVRIYDLDQSETIQTLKRDDNERTTFYSVMPLGESLICAGDDSGKLFVWDMRAPEKVVFSSHDCEQYISGIDGRSESRKIVCTSGEGTLTAYDLRANKMIEPQSELFEAGFQCVKLVEANKKVVIGGEDGAIYVFNQNEWAHTSDNSEFIAACSDGRVRSLTLWPHQILSETVVCKRNSLDTMQVSPHKGKSEILVGGDKYLNLVAYEDKAESEMEDDDQDSSGEQTKCSDAGDAMDIDSSKNDSERTKSTKGPTAEEDGEADLKKLKVNTEDYLNVFE